MNGGKDKDFPFFGDSFKDMSREMNDMHRFMEEMFKNIETGFPQFNKEGTFPPVNIPNGFPPTNSPDSPPLNPRDQMLRDDTDDGYKFLLRDSQDDFPRFGGQRQPFSGMKKPDDRLSPISDGKPIFMSRMKGVQTVRHDDGSIERTETVQQDGQICKTVTITDPSGKSSSTTSCERADGPRQILQSSPFLKVPRPEIDQGVPNKDVPNIEVPSGNSGLNKEDSSFFSKLFGGFWNKPKS